MSLFKKRPKEALTNVCLFDARGKLKSPMGAEVGMVAYALALSADGGADILDELKDGETVNITVPIDIPYNKDKFTICCMLADTFTLAGVPRQQGNDSGTIYTLGKKAKGYYADPLRLEPEEFRRVHQFYFQILEEFYGIPVIAKDHYDQIVRKHEELTGKPFLRDQSLGDDGGNWHGNIKQDDAESDRGPGYGMNFGEIDKRGKQSYHNYAFWKFAKPNETHSIGNATIIDLPKTLVFIEEFFRKTGGPGIADEDVNKATMSFAALFTNRALQVAQKCSQLVYGDDYGSKESGIYAMLEALGYEEQKIETALEVLTAEDDSGQTTAGSEDKRRGSASKTDQSDKPGKADKPDKSQKEDGYEEDPDIKEGRLVSFKTIELVIADIRAATDEAKGDKKAQLLTAILVLQDALTQAKNEESGKNYSDDKKEKIGARYLNWKLEQSNVLRIKLPNGKSVYFNESKKN